MSTKTGIFNLALTHLGNGTEVSNPDTDRSQEAQACRRVYDEARKATLRDFEWPFASKQVALGLVSNNPTSQWAFSYQMPPDCLHFRKVLSYRRNDTRQSRVPYRIFYGASGNEIYTDQCDAEAEYTVDVIDTSRFPPDFVMALSLRMSVYMAPRLTAGDPFHLGDKCMQMYRMEISRAVATAVNEEQEEQDPESEFIRARGGDAGMRSRDQDNVDYQSGFAVD